MTIILDEPITEDEKSLILERRIRMKESTDNGTESGRERLLRVRKAEVKAYFDNIRFTDIDVTGELRVRWGAVGIGFGELYMYSDADLLMIDNECMSKEFLKKLFCKIIDQSTLSDEPFDNDK